MTFTAEQPDQWVVAIPTNKADVTREIDLIEEVLRVFGFANIPLPGKMHTSIAIEARHNPHRMRRLFGQFLASGGFLEVMNMSLTQPAYYKNLEWADSHQWVTIHNTSNESLNLLRPEMILPMLETIKRNVNRKQEDLRLFEFGKSYLQSNESPEETEHLILSMSGLEHPAGWQGGEAKNMDFFSLKAAVHALLFRLGIPAWKSTEIKEEGAWDYGLAYAVGSLGFVKFGKVSKSLCDRFDIRQEVFIADFLVEPTIGLSSRSVTVFEELNRFPAVIRDLAIVVSDDIKYEQVKEVVLEAGGKGLTNLEVFDIYKNEDQVGAGKMSMALRFTIENKEATLSDKEIDQWFNKIQKALISGVNAEIRK
jgi:phenylalanyl-tRNA synthetase beta chain